MNNSPLMTVVKSVQNLPKIQFYLMQSQLMFIFI